MGHTTDVAETLSPAEVGAVTGAPVRAVYKAAQERLPAGRPAQRGRERRLTRWEAVCFAIDRAMPRDVPLPVRRQLDAGILARGSAEPARCERGILTYVVDVQAASDRVDRELARYRDAMALVVVDEAVQGGIATFRGTRIPVHQVAALLKQGATEAELGEDYHRLTPQMIAAAPVYARAHPRRGRPRKPGWRASGEETGGMGGYPAARRKAAHGPVRTEASSWRPSAHSSRRWMKSSPFQFRFCTSFVSASEKNRLLGHCRSPFQT